jgi:hypothetical protein
MSRLRTTVDAAAKPTVRFSIVRRRKLVIAAAALAVGGATVAVMIGLNGAETSPQPVAPAAPAAQVASADPKPPVTVPTSSVPPAVNSPSTAPQVHVAAAPAAKPPKATAWDEAPSDRIRDRVNQVPLNPRPQGQVTGPGIIPQNGTRTVTTPTPLPNPAENPTTYTPSVQPGP